MHPKVCPIFLLIKDISSKFAAMRMTYSMNSSAALRDLGHGIALR